MEHSSRANRAYESFVLDSSIHSSVRLFISPSPQNNLLLTKYLQNGIKVNFGLNWIHVSYGSDSSVQLAQDKFSISSGWKFDKQVTCMLKWTAERSIQLTVRIETVSCDLWTYRFCILHLAFDDIYSFMHMKTYNSNYFG